jgi:hypothetical protein
VRIEAVDVAESFDGTADCLFIFSDAEISLKHEIFSVVVANLRTFKLGTSEKKRLFTLQ